MPWSQQEDDFLIKNIDHLPIRTIAQQLGRTLGSAKCRQFKLNLHQPKREYVNNQPSAYTDEEIQYLKDNWATKWVPEMAAHLGRTQDAVKKKGNALGLFKTLEQQIAIRSKKPVRKSAKKFDKWTPDEVQFLTDNFNKKSYRELADELNRSFASVVKKSHSLGFKGTKNTLYDPQFKNPKSPLKLGQITDEVRQFIADNWGQLSALKLSRKLNISIGSIRYQASKMGLSGPIKTAKKREKATNERTLFLDPWTDEKLQYLRDNFHAKYVFQIALDLGRSLYSVKRMAAKLGLRRSEEEKKALLLTPESLPDNMVIDRITRDQDESRILMDHPEILDVKRHQIILNRIVKKQTTSE